MVFDLAKLARLNEFSMKLPSAGSVIFVSLSTRHLSEIEKNLTAPNVKGLEFTRWLFGELAKHQVGDSSKDADPADFSSFSVNSLNGLSDEDLEKFADTFVLNYKYLSLTHQDVDVSKLVHESACDYLVRVFRHYGVQQTEQRKRMSEMSSLDGSRTVKISGSLLDTHSILKQLKNEKSAFDLSKKSLQHGHIESLKFDAMKDIALRFRDSDLSIASLAILNREQDLMSTSMKAMRAVQDDFNRVKESAALAKAMYGQDELVRVAFSGFSQDSKLSTLMENQLRTSQQIKFDLQQKHDALFRLPLEFEANRLLASQEIGALAKFAQNNLGITDIRELSLRKIESPWIHKAESWRSVAAILEVQSLGKALRAMDGFDPGLTSALRADFGDWRDKITFPEAVFVDPVARVDFYSSRGFNTSLTDFPNSAFYQNLEISGLDGDELDANLFGHFPKNSIDPSEEIGLHRTNKCHDRLQRFERALRKFINETMTAQYGPDWPKQRLDPKIFELWEFKKKRAESGGLILTFIDVADFTDYENIICKKDHWREVFEVRFKRKESVRESFQRLQPIRVSAMHSRIVTQADELYLVVEVVRLLNAIK
jgi:hypothetical protein